MGWKRRGDLVGPDREDPDGGERERVVKSDDACSPFWGQDVVILLVILRAVYTVLRRMPRTSQHRLGFVIPREQQQGEGVGGGGRDGGDQHLAASTPASERRSNPGRVTGS